METGPPELLEIWPVVLPLPVVLDNRVTGGVRLVRERGYYFMHGMPVGQRGDEWLEDRDATVKGSHVAPALERMECWNVPVAHGGGLILEKSEVYPSLHMVQPGSKRHIGRCCVCGISIQDHQQGDIAGLHVGDELAQ